MPIKYRELCQKTVTGTADATPGTRKNIAHGLGYAPAISAIRVVAQGVNGDTDDAGTVNIVSADATNVVVKSNKASQAFTLVIATDTKVAAPVVAQQ